MGKILRDRTFPFMPAVFVYYSKTIPAKSSQKQLHRINVVILGEASAISA